jgi:hypothetical protein
MNPSITERLARVGAVLFLLVLSGCARIEPVYNVQNHPLPAQAMNLRGTGVTDAVAEAAAADGWQVERIAPGQLRATQTWREHAAIVMITCTDSGFSIRNDGSTNLLDNGGWIHKEYNKRVHKLESAIEQRLQRS